jgi:hypothetical protein
VTFLAGFDNGFDARDDLTGFRALEERRAADTLRDALICSFSVTRRAGIIISFVLLPSQILYY